jgi:F-type H+-transporting ATPase subunit delta
MGLAQEQQQLDRVVSDLELLQRTIRESKDFLVFLKSPVIKKEKKREILTTLFRQTISDLTLQFILLLCEKGREDILPQIIHQFFVLRDERLGIVGVDVRAAVELTPDQRNLLRERFEGITKKTVRLTFSLDKLLKGGFIARVGDTVFDGSIRHQLERMRAQFVEGTAHR